MGLISWKIMSPSPEPLSPGSKNNESKIENAWPLCNQTVNLKKDCKALYYSILKFKYSPSVSKHNKCSMKYASLNNSHNNCHSNYTNRIYLQKHMFWLIDRSLPPTGRMPWINLRLWGFLCARDAGRRGNNIISGKCAFVLERCFPSLRKQRTVCDATSDLQ